MFVSGMDQDVSVPGTYEFGLNYTDENGNKYDLTLVIVSEDNGQGGEGGEDNPPSEDIENVKKEALSAMDSAWETLGDWADLDNYAAAYSELRAKVEGATTNDEINSYMNEFNALCETIFGELKVELADELADVWAEFSAMGDVSAYESEYAAYCNELQAITNIDDLIALVDEVNDFLDEVYEALNGNEGGEDGKPTIVKVELINGTVTYEIGSNISFSELLNKNGTAINIMYSDGTGKATFITPDMFATGMDQNINVPGTYEFGLVYTDDNGEKYKLILVVISVDNGQGGEDNEDITGNYKFVGNEFFSAAGFAGVEIYADGTLSFLGTDGNVYPSCNYVLLYDNVIVADFYGQLYMVISIDTASKTADFYTDTMELPLIGEYKLYMGDETMVTTFSVYEVTVYGMNLTYAYGPIGSTDAGVTFTYMTILCGLDLDEGILNYGGQDFIINEDNTLTPAGQGGEDGPGGGEEPDLPTDGTVINTTAMEYFTALGIYGIKLYDNDTYSFIFADGSVNDETFSFYYYDESTIVVYFQGMIPMVLTVYEDNSATMYSPMGDVMVLGTYFMEAPMPDGSVARSTFSVLDYYINGMNVIIAYGPVGTQDTLTFTDLTFLGSLDLEAGTLSYAGMTLYINEDGSLSTSRPGAGDNTLDSYKKEVLYTIADEWDYLSEYVELDNYEEEYKYIYESILNASTIEEAKDYEAQFYGLYDKILSDIRIMLQQQMDGAWVGYNQRGDVTVFTKEYNGYFYRVSNAASIDELVELVDLITELFERIEDHLNGEGGDDVYDTVKKLVEEAWNYFYNFNNAFGYVWEETYYPLAQQHISNIECATSIDEAEAYFKKFLAACDVWANNFNTEVKVQYIDINSYSAEFTQGVSADEVIEWILNNVYATVHFTDGSSTVIRLTEDMIMGELPEVLDDIDAYYELNISIEYDYYGTNCYFSIRLNPDVSDVTVIGSFKRGEGDTDYLFEFAGITLYDNRIALVENYEGDSEYFEYFTYGDELISIRVDGVEVYYSINRESGIFSDFVYSENVIGEYNVLDEGITLIFTGDYAGSGYYFVKYGAYVTEELFDFVTIEMYLDLESGIIIFLEQEMGIFEDGVTVDTIVTDERKENYASYLINEWNNYCSSYDLSELKDRYEALLAEIDSLKYNHELDKWRDAREEFLSDLYNLVNGSEGEDKPIEVYLVKAYLTGWSVSVPQYADYSSTAELLNANGISVCYEYSDGSRYYGPITEDMVTLQIDTSVAGSYVFAIEINTEAGMFMGSVSVEVIGVEQPDVPDIDTTTYTFSENTDIFYSLVLSNSSNSGTLNTFEGGIQIYYNDCGEYFEVDAGVATFLFAYDKEGLTVFNYAPDYSTASSYYLQEDDTYMLFDVLGEYYGADWYVCNYYASVGEIEARCTIKVWIDLESSILRTADFDEVTFIINPDCSLSFYGSGSGEDNIEEIQYLAEKAWDYFYSYVDKFGYEFENKYGSAFKEYYSRIKSASSYEEAKMYYSEFCLVCKTWADEFGSSAVPSINYIELNSGSAEFLLGVTSSEVIDWIVSNVTATVYFSDGSEETIAVTYDMIRNYLPEVLDELDRYYEVGVELSYNGYNYSYDYIRIVISPDLSGASVLGSYKRAENDMDYCFEFAAITIYDNGIILVEDYDGDSAYAEFGWYLDNVITVNVDSVDVYYSFDNETGIFTDYVPEGEVIGKYNVYDEGITLIFVGEYTGAGEYFVLYGLEEGDISDFVTIKMYLDMESCRIIFLEQELIILEDNTVVTAINEESRKDARKYLVEEWEYNSQYYDLSELQAEYDELLAMLDSFKYQHELYEWYDMREEFLQKLYNIVNNSQPELPKDFYIYVETLLNECHNAWWDYVNRYGYAVEDKYAPLFNKLIDNLQNADSYDEVYKLQDEFENLFDMIESNFGGMDSVYVQYVEISKQDYDVVEGTSFDEFIKLFLETSYLTLYYSDGHSEQLAISYDMLSFYNGTVDTFTYGYDFHFGVNYDFGNTSGSFGVSVTVNPDMSNATLVGTFVYADGTPDPMTSIVKYEFYDNGMFIAYSPYGETATVPYIFVYDNVIGINVMGSAYALYSLDFENGYISSYAPVSEVYAKYTLGVYEDLEICPAMTIYNERNAEGAYVATIEGWADPSMKMWVSITMLVSVDEESGLIWYAGQPMIAVDGVLMPYVSEEEIAGRIESMKSEWEFISMNYDVSAYAEQYKAIIEAMYSVNNYYDYSALCDQFYEMVNQIYMNGDMGGDIGGDVSGGNESDKWEDPSSPVDGAAELFYFDIANPIPYLGNHISIYDNGYVAIYGEHGTVYCDYEVEGENILLLNFNGVIIIYELDFESFIAKTYKEEVFYGPYTDYYDNGDFERIYVYGEYAGAGEYAGLYEMCDDGTMYAMSVAFYFDLDKMYIDLGPTILYFDGNGDIYEVVHKDSGSDSEAPDSGSDSDSGEVELPSVDMGNDYSEVVSPDYSYSVNDGNYNAIIGEATTNPSYSYDVSYGELVTDGEYSFTVNGDGTAEYIYAVNGEDDELKYSYVTVK